MLAGLHLAACNPARHSPYMDLKGDLSMTGLPKKMEHQPPMARPAISTEAVHAGFRAVFRIFEQWHLSGEEGMILLGRPARSTYYGWRQGKIGTVPNDTVDRISLLLGIYKNIQLLMTDTNLADRWVREPNRAFGGQSALQRMLAGQMMDLAAVRSYLDAARGVW